MNFRLAMVSDRNDEVSTNIGRTIAEAVSRWLPTEAVRVQSRVWSTGICGGQSGVGAGFLRVLQFPLPLIPPNSLSSQSPGAGTIGPSLDSNPHYANLKKNLQVLSNILK
jgi:hypothetical protein